MNRRAVLLAMLAAAAPRPALADQIYDTSAGPLRLETVADGLARPWSLAFLPEGQMLVSERPGNLRVVSADGKVSAPVAGLAAIAVEGQGGLLDIALDPAFADNRLVYLSFTEPRGDGNGTSVMRGRLSADLTRLDGVEVIFRQQPGATGGHHFGSRLVFDRTGALFITTGDRNLREAVQRPDTHIGKILRIMPDGGVPPDNPKPQGWLPEIWSIGHRNLQGAALHPETGVLWTVEHGAKGGDELNRPQAGKNYGWPVISYGREYSGARIGEGQAMDGMEQPVHFWEPSIAPSGMAFYTGDRYPGWQGNLFVGALVQEHLVRVVMTGERVTGEERLFEGVARIRDVRQGPDGFLYLLTDEKAPDGRILRVVPA
ncbi:MAG: PQQ-dependent sugar dehydrogenase [Aestuariivirga sp.]|uniref:PQQ-dependent sugar dehydrogenase n=1 Tax=Aestuariivirga sp. TaxID=2650926 RepID=UPI0038D04C93